MAQIKKGNRYRQIVLRYANTAMRGGIAAEINHIRKVVNLSVLIL